MLSFNAKLYLTFKPVQFLRIRLLAVEPLNGVGVPVLIYHFIHSASSAFSKAFLYPKVVEQSFKALRRVDKL